MATYTWTSGDCTVTYNDATHAMTVRANNSNGRMADYTSLAYQPWASYRTAITSISFPYQNYDVKHIGNYAFDGCTNVTSITFTSVRGDIGSYAFHGCTSLTSVNLGAVTSVGHGQFGSDTSLSSLTISSSTTSIGEYAFQLCSSLTSISFSSASWYLSSIGQGAFSLGRSGSPVTATVYSASNIANGRLDAYKNNYTTFSYQASSWKVTIQSNNTSYGTVNYTQLNVSPNASVSISSNQLTIQSTTVTATPQASTQQYIYAFGSWTAPSTITQDTTITANFTRTLQTYRVTFVSNNTSYGTVSLVGTSATYYDVQYGTALTISSNQVIVGQPYVQQGWKATATAQSPTQQYYYVFSSWSNVPSTVTGNVTITANFTRSTTTYAVTVVVNPSGYGSVSKLSITDVPYGSSISTNNNVLSVVKGSTVETSTATPQSRTQEWTYAFQNWTGVPQTVTGNITVTANFTRTRNQYTVTVNVNDSEMGELSKDGGRTRYSQLTVTADYGTAVVTSGMTLIVGQNTVLAIKDQSNTVSFSEWQNAPSTIVGNVTVTQTFIGIQLNSIALDQSAFTLSPLHTNYVLPSQLAVDPANWNGVLHWSIFSGDIKVADLSADGDYYSNQYFKVTIGVTRDGQYYPAMIEAYEGTGGLGFYVTVSGKQKEWSASSITVSTGKYLISVSNYIVVRFYLDARTPYLFGDQGQNYCYIDKYSNPPYQWIDRGDGTVIPPDPQIQGQVFGGWYDMNGNRVDIPVPPQTTTATTPHYSTYCYASWTRKYIPTDYDQLIIQQLNSDADMLIKQLDMGMVSEMTKRYTPNATPTPTPTMSSSNTFIIDLNVQCAVTVTVRRKNPQEPNDQSFNPDKWSNAKWLEEVRALVDRWQSETDGVKVLYLPRDLKTMTLFPGTSREELIMYGSNTTIMGYIENNTDNLGLLYGDNNEYKLIGDNAIITSYSDKLDPESNRLISVSMTFTLGGMLSNYQPYRKVLE